MSVAEPTGPTTALRKDAVGVVGILFFVLSAQAPLTGIVGAAALAVALGNGAGAPGAYLVVGLVIIVFAVGFTTITRYVDSVGGFYALIRAGLGVNVARVGSWLALITYNTIQAAMYGLFGATASGLIARYLHVDVAWWAIVLATVALVYAFGRRNIEVGARVLAVLVSAEVAILVAFAIGVIARGSAPHGFDLTASFGPHAIAAGAPGIAVLFAIASMFGFESTAIYAGEAREPRRTVPRATYLSVSLIAVFFALIMWVLISYYGAGAAQGAALDTLATDPGDFVLGPVGSVLGGWAADLTSVLLCTSLLAGLLAFHNIVNRYLHAMAEHDELPRPLCRTNRHQAPAVAAGVQSLTVVAVMAWFMVGDKNPVATLFGWLSGQAVAALVVLYVLVSVSIIRYFRAHRVHSSAWSTAVAPAASVVLMLGELYIIVRNFQTLTGGSQTTCQVLLWSVPAVTLLGWLASTAFKRRALARGAVEAAVGTAA